MNDDINEYVPSILNPRTVKKNSGNFTLTQNSITSRCSLSLRKNGCINNTLNKNIPFLNNKENTYASQNNSQLTFKNQLKKTKNINKNTKVDNKKNNSVNVKNGRRPASVVSKNSIGPSAIDDIISKNSRNLESSPINFGEPIVQTDKTEKSIASQTTLKESHTIHKTIDDNVCDNKNTVSISFGIENCESLAIATKNVHITALHMSCKNNGISVDCDVVETFTISTDNSDNDTIVIESPSKRHAETNIDLVIKKKKLSEVTDKYLILKTDANDKLSHVIVQPPNFKLSKREQNKSRSISKPRNENLNVKLKQKSIECYFKKYAKGTPEKAVCDLSYVVKNDMSKNSPDVHKIKARTLFSHSNEGSSCSQRVPRDLPFSSPSSLRQRKSAQVTPRIVSSSPRRSPMRKEVESLHFPLQSLKQTKSVPPKTMPHYKIVAGTHFAVDAFSYGEIPNVEHYFLTHFHSDHYIGLKRTFRKTLHCSKISADLCISRLGVDPKYIQVIDVDEIKQIDNVEITALDANHCPGALMLVFCLPNGKSILHTGDFRAHPLMESYPVFWNKDIHTVYLDTTYCHPRYDFPTQDESLEMAVSLLHDKKKELEKENKKFSSVLIVCGTYTIGKEKFFLGLSRRVGCGVWACAEKDLVLQAVEGQSFHHKQPQLCQLHVVPMRDLNVETLRGYLHSLRGPFTEVVAFKPSGWENSKNTVVKSDDVTIFGIPYSEHSSFSEMVRFIKFLMPKQVVPTVEIGGGIKNVQKHFPCPLLYKEDMRPQSRLTDFFSIPNKMQGSAIT